MNIIRLSEVQWNHVGAWARLVLVVPELEKMWGREVAETGRADEGQGWRVRE